MLPDPNIKPVVLSDYTRIIARRIRLILALIAVIPLIVALVVFTMKPIYRATTSILIEKSPLKVTKFEELRQNLSGFMDTQQYYQTQYKILGSRTLAERVFEELRLGNEKEFKDGKDPVQKLINNINIEPVRGSQIVLLRVDSIDALRASLIANTLAKAYIQQDIESRKVEARGAVKWLEAQLEGIKNKQTEAGDALNKYVQENKIVTTPDIEKRLKTLLETLKETKSQKETELAEALKRYKEKHPKIIALRAELEDIKSKIESETTAFLGLTQKMMQYNLLKKESESTEQLYNEILMRVRETNISEKLETSVARIIDPAEIPEKPDRPKKLFDIAASILFAMLCGISAAFLMEYFQSAIYTADDVRYYLRLPFLGYISTMGKDALTDSERDLIYYKKPDSMIAEAYRKIMAAVIFATPEDRPLKSILVTSSIPKEGTASIALNLATVFSQAGERVVVMDVSLQNTRIYKSLGLEAKPGLSDLLAGNAKLEDIIKSTAIKDLSIIPSGAAFLNMSGMLVSGKVQSLLKTINTKFDRIILDCPPILSAADPSLLASAVDGVVLIIRGGHTHLNTITHAKETILKTKGDIIGVLINNADILREDRYYYHHYYKRQ